MGAALDHYATHEYDDLVAIADGGEAMRDHQAGDASTADRDVDCLLSDGVQCARSLVHDKHAGVEEECPRDTNTLPLAGPAIAISDTLGINARTTPSREGAVIGIVPNGAVLPVVGRSADNEWVQVTLPDSQRAWMFRSAVNASSNVDSAPVVGEEMPAVATTPAATDGAASAMINTLLGSNVRPQPLDGAEPLETLAMGSVLPVTARSADNLWLQVQLADGQVGWILAATADLSVDVAALPVAP